MAITLFNPSLPVGGIPLPTFLPADLARMEAGISPSDIWAFAYRETAGKHRDHIPMPGKVGYPPFRLHALRWPQPASKWAYIHLLCDDATLNRLRPLVYSAGGANPYLNPLTLTLSDGSTTGTISTNLYLLPPRPLHRGQPASGLWILTLVDARYFYWWKAGDAPVQLSDTWTSFLSTITTQLGIMVVQDAVSAGYLSPPLSFTTHYEYLPQLLDAWCYSVGHRFVRQLNGALITQQARTAKAVQDPQIQGQPANWRAGGAFSFAPIQNNDQNALSPQSVTVVFPVQSTGVPIATLHTEVVTLTSLGLPEYAGANGYPGTELVHSSACFRDSTDGGNAAEITALAKQIAQDYYLWRLARAEIRFDGIKPWKPTGMDDVIEWSHRGGQVTTTIRRAPWNAEPLELGHRGTTGTYSNLHGGEGQSLTGERLAHPFGQYFNAFMALTSYSATISSNTDNLVFGGKSGVSWLKLALTGDFNLTGLANPAGGHLLFVTTSGGTLTLKHQQTSANQNQFTLPGAIDFVVSNPGGFVCAWDSATLKWELVASLTAGGSTSGQAGVVLTSLAPIATVNGLYYDGFLATFHSDTQSITLGGAVWVVFPNGFVPFTTASYYLARHEVTQVNPQGQGLRDVYSVAQMGLMGGAGPNHQPGFVPTPGPVADSSGAWRFLRSDATWSVPIDTWLAVAKTPGTLTMNSQFGAQILDFSNSALTFSIHTPSFTSIAAGFSSGAQTVTPASMAGIAVGTWLIVDEASPLGPNREVVQVTATTATTFTATFLNKHTVGPVQVFAPVWVVFVNFYIPKLAGFYRCRTEGAWTDGNQLFTNQFLPLTSFTFLADVNCVNGVLIKTFAQESF